MNFYAPATEKIPPMNEILRAIITQMRIFPPLTVPTFHLELEANDC